jgi:integrase
VKPAAGRVYLWDDTLKGFGLMVTHNDARSYIVQYRIGGRGAPTRRYTIGPHANPWTPEKARGRAEEVLELVRRRIDPFDAEKTRLEANRSAREAAERYAFSVVADAFVKDLQARKLRSADDIAAVFRRDLTPFFLGKPLPSISRADVHDRLSALGKRSQSAANKAHSWLRALFAWAVDQGSYGITSSPMFAMSPPFATVQRKRVLDGEELRRTWEGAAALREPFGALVKLLILTGQRLREVAEMRWEEVDFANAVWRVPGSRTKNGHDHLCPLSTQAIAVLAGVQPDGKKRKGFVITTTSTKPVAGFSRAKKRLDAIMVAQEAKRASKAGVEPATVPNWTFHDLRRSLATGLQALGFPIEVNEAVINHVSGRRGGLARVYQLHDYRAEKAKALQSWGDHIASVIADIGNPSSNEVS